MNGTGGKANLQRAQRRQLQKEQVRRIALRFLWNHTREVYSNRMQSPCAAAAAPFSCVEDSEKWRSVRMSPLQPAHQPGVFAFCIAIRCASRYIPLTSTRLPENIFVFPAISPAASYSSRMRHIFAAHSPAHVIVNHPLSRPTS